MNLSQINEKKLYFNKTLLGFFSILLLLCGFFFYNFGFASASSRIPYTLSGTYLGNGISPRAITGLGFQPEVVMIKTGNAADAQTVIRTSTMDGTVEMAAGGAAGPSTGLIANTINSLDVDGFTIGNDIRVNSDGVNYYWVAFRSDEGFEKMAIGTYDGDGNATQGVGGGMHFLPDYVIVINNSGLTAPKHRSSTMTWGHSFFSEAVNNSRITRLDNPENFADNNYGFTVGNSTSTNAFGSTYSYVAWKNLAGRMKTGSYTGNGVDDRNITGVGFQPEVVWITPENVGIGSTWRPASLLGDLTLSFNIFFATINNQIQALITDGFNIGNFARVNQNTVTYNYMAWAQTVPPRVTTDLLPDGEVTAEYSQQLGASGGDGAYTLWVLTSGNLPDGLNLDGNTGIISGTPTTPGTSNFGITVVSADQPSVEKLLSITVIPAPSISTTTVPVGRIGRAYTKTLEAVGGTGVYTTWTLTAGGLFGLNLNPATGIISGTPNAAGSGNFSVTVTDSNGVVSAPVSLLLTITSPPSILGGIGGGVNGFGGPEGGVSGDSNSGSGSDSDSNLDSNLGSGSNSNSSSDSNSGSSQNSNSTNSNVTDQKITLQSKPFFLDTPGTWAEKEIDKLRSDCNVLGYRDVKGNLLHLFRPDNKITRAELVTMIIRCKYGVQPKAVKSPFPADVPLEHWATPYIYKAWKEGIVQGFADGTFGLNKNATTAETLKMILLVWAKSSEIDASGVSAKSTCSEVHATDWYAKYYNFAEKNGISDGFPNAKGKLDKLCAPNTDATRGVVAKLVVESKELK